VFRAECLRYEAQIKAIDIVPRGRANATRLAHADGYVDDLLCHNSRFRAAPRPRLVVILRRKLRRGLLRGLLRSGEASFFFSSAGSILLTSVVPMQRRKIGVIVRAATTLALLASGASADAADVAICSLVAKPSNFDRQAVTFQGIATAVKKTTSRRGNDYTLFKLQGPGDCGTVDVFMWGHPKLSNGDHVRVEGVFESVHHQDRSVFYNQVEATKVLPVPK